MMPNNEGCDAARRRHIGASRIFLKIMLSLHGLLGLALLAWPAHWHAWLLIFVAIHAAVGALTLQPRNPLFGPNLTRLPAPSRRRHEVAITFDDGPDPQVTPRILDILERYGTKASFFVVGERLRLHPDLAREIVRRGHSLENHSSGHPLLFSLFSAGALRREIETAQAAVAAICGQPPHFFRPPAGFHSPLLSPVLAALDLRLATWTRRGFDTRDSNAARVLGRLTRNLSAGDILLLHDGNAARDAGAAPVVLELLPRLLAELQARGLHGVTLQQASRLADAADQGRSR